VPNGPNGIHEEWIRSATGESSIWKREHLERPHAGWIRTFGDALVTGYATIGSKG
jgi:hypothetical protein